jgi:hypothetical protein
MCTFMLVTFLDFQLQDLDDEHRASYDPQTSLISIRAPRIVVCTLKITLNCSFYFFLAVKYRLLLDALSPQPSTLNAGINLCPT